MYKIWQCKECNDIVVSNSYRHHEMNFCKCDRSGVDFEEYGCRFSGYVKEIKDLDYNFFDEILLNLSEQNKFRDLGVKGNRFNKTIQFCRKTEDKILKDYLKETYNGA